jgi:hypothetical protein
MRSERRYSASAHGMPMCVVYDETMLNIEDFAAGYRVRRGMSVIVFFDEIRQTFVLHKVRTSPARR